jgi:CRP-like cAMP-binding protein
VRGANYRIHQEEAVFLKRPSDRVRALSAIPLFRDLGRSDLEEISRMTYEVTRQPGELLVRQGDAGAEMYLLLSGTARVEADGRALEEVGPNRVIGEMALVDKHRRMASVVATTECVALVVPYDKFWPFLQRAPEVQRHLLITMSRRVRTMQERLLEHTTASHEPAIESESTEI